MNTRSQESANHNFFIGLVAGGAIGAGLAILLAPRLASELRERVTDTANDLGDAVSRRYQDVTARVADVTSRVVDAADAITARGQAARDDVADAVGRGAREVEHFAAASKTGYTAKK